MKPITTRTLIWLLGSFVFAQGIVLADSPEVNSDTQPSRPEKTTRKKTTTTKTTSTPTESTQESEGKVVRKKKTAPPVPANRKKTAPPPPASQNAKEDDNGMRQQQFGADIGFGHWDDDLIGFGFSGHAQYGIFRAEAAYWKDREGYAPDRWTDSMWFSQVRVGLQLALPKYSLAYVVGPVLHTWHQETWMLSHGLLFEYTPPGGLGMSLNGDWYEKMDDPATGFFSIRPMALFDIGPIRLAGGYQWRRNFDDSSVDGGVFQVGVRF